MTEPAPPPAPARLAAPQRPTLLSVGIALQALHAVLAAFLYGLGGLLAAGVLGVSLSEVAIFQVWPFSLIAALGALLFFVAVGFQLLMLYACWRAWESDRAWLWVLIGLSLLGLVSTGPLSALVGIATIVGAYQHIEELDGKR